MKISKTVQTEKGRVRFEGDVTQQEYDLIMEIGLNVLLAQGAIPFALRQIEEESEDSPPPDNGEMIH